MEAPPRRLLIVKLGGAAITDKQHLETLRPEVLQRCAHHLKAVLAEQPDTRLLIVHGAGSFGHIQAAAANVQHGGIHTSTTVQHAFLTTRLSVTQLNHTVVRTLVAVGVPAVGVSLCGHWMTRNREVVAADVGDVKRCLAAGLVPVLHGDAVMDDSLGCTILGGDKIVAHLAATLRPASVVFLTNVPGVYDQPPEDNKEAKLLRNIEISPDGAWKNVVQLDALKFTNTAHDTTGGIQVKVAEAAGIAAQGIDVLIAEAGSASGLVACQKGPYVAPEWIGTHVKPT